MRDFFYIRSTIRKFLIMKSPLTKVLRKQIQINKRR